MEKFHYRAYLLTLLATLLSVALLIRIGSGPSAIQRENTFFLFAGVLVKYPFIHLSELFVSMFTVETVLLYVLRKHYYTTYLVPAHTLLSNLLLTLLIGFNPDSRPSVCFNLMAFLVIIQVWFLIALTLAILHWSKRSKKLPATP